MRKPLLLLFIIGTLFSCSKNDVKQALVVSFELPLKVDFSIPGAVPTGRDTTLPAIPITTNWNSILSANQTSLSQIKDMNVKTMVLKIKSPSGQSLNFLKSISLSISATGQRDTVIAFTNPVPTNTGDSLSLGCPLVDVSPYIKQNQFSIKVTLQVIKTVATKMDLESTIDFYTQAYLIN